MNGRRKGIKNTKIVPVITENNFFLILRIHENVRDNDKSTYSEPLLFYSCLLTLMLNCV